VGGCFYLKLSGTEAKEEEAELLDACVAGATNQQRPFSLSSLIYTKKSCPGFLPGLF
jgi:hypothetical protein